MCKKLVLFAFFVLCSGVFGQLRDNYSDTWVGVDGLGRELPGYEKCGEVRKDKFVGIFYWIWHHGHQDDAYDITEILKDKKGERKWGPENVSHHWGRPELGYYRTGDSYVLRKHASMLTDAGVDVVIFDTTNSPWTFKEQYDALFEEFGVMRATGERTPQAAFMGPFGDSSEVVKKLYDDIYSKGKYKELWFLWDGKPLMMADKKYFVDDPNIYNFFTFRKPVPSYFTGPSGADQWGWLEVYPQHEFYDSDGNVEQMVVGVAQNAVGEDLSMMSHKAGAMGRSWVNGAKLDKEGAVNYGYNFAQQWRRALKADPEFIFITGWNEWTAGRFKSWYKYTTADSFCDEGLFVDQFDQEYSRDIEPMEAGHGDNYYYQMMANIREFKGVRKQTKDTQLTTIKVDGDFADWEDVKMVYRDTVGDTIGRDFVGYGKQLRYKNVSGRNDFVETKVCRDKRNVYFYAQTAGDITDCNGSNWMLLFVDTDMDSKTGWFGYDVLVNGEVVDGDTTVVKHWTKGKGWQRKAKVCYKAKGNKLETAIPLKVLSENGDAGFDFHWADNIENLDDISAFFNSGDSAPNRRLNYRYSN